MSLQDEIDERSREIHTDRYSMSINEAIAMYQDKELEIHPEFQRIFRWTLEQQSRLVESVFLGIPVPPIFVAQRTDGIWDVVDGVQRLSTLFRFAGVLRTADGEPDRPEPLLEGEYLPGLRGVFWAADVPVTDGNKQSTELTDAQRRFFKRARLDFQIVQKESDEQAKFDLFQRLNSGTRLSEQEARSCLAVMLDPDFARWLEALANNQDYEATVDISDRREQEAYDVESVLRYLAIVNTPGDGLVGMGDVGDFLTRRMRDFISDPSFNRDAQRQRFEFVFDVLNTALGSGAFKRYDAERDDFRGKFSISAFEAIASGVAMNEDAWRTVAPAERSPLLRQRARAVWEDSVFEERSGGGKAAERRIPYMAEVGKRIFSIDANG
jgi:hypothetical protein